MIQDLVAWIENPESWGLDSISIVLVFVLGLDRGSWIRELRFRVHVFGYWVFA